MPIAIAKSSIERRGAGSKRVAVAEFFAGIGLVRLAKRDFASSSPTTSTVTQGSVFIFASHHSLACEACRRPLDTDEGSH
jgi:hypothetical protein